MKTIRIITLCAALLCAGAAQAQGLGGLLKGITGSSASDVVTGILGKVGITTSSIEGTWTYKSPCVVFNSDNLLSSLGSNLVTGKINTYMGNALTKAGIKPGAMQMEFRPDGSCRISVGGRGVDATYKLTGSTLTLTFPVARKSVPMNVNLDANNLQFAMKVDKLLTLLQSISTQAAGASGPLGTVGSLLKSYDGMQLGLKFERK